MSQADDIRQYLSRARLLLGVALLLLTTLFRLLAILLVFLLFRGLCLRCILLWRNFQEAVPCGALSCVLLAKLDIRAESELARSSHRRRRVFNLRRCIPDGGIGLLSNVDIALLRIKVCIGERA